MTSLVVFRPGLATNRTAFEAEAQVYQRLQERYGYEVSMAVSEDDSFDHPSINLYELPPKSWESSLPFFPVYLHRISYRSQIDPLFRDADVLLTDDPTRYLQSLFAGRRARNHDLPVVYETSLTIPGIGSETLWKLFRKRQCRRVLQEAAGIVVTVPKGLERFRTLGLYTTETAEKFSVVGHPVDTALFNPGTANAKTDQLRIVVVSRLVPEKGWSYILEALTPILQARDDVKLDIVGEGPMRPVIERRIATEGVEDSSTFHGTVPHDEVPKILNQGDIFVNHPVTIGTWEEFFGVVNLEAMACELPCVLSRCGAVPSVVDEDAVELVPERDVVAIREAVRALLDDPTRRQQMGERSRSYVKEHFDIDVIAAHYHDVLRGALW